MPRLKVHDETRTVRRIARYLYGDGYGHSKRLAHELGVAEITIKRWSRGHGKPTLRHIHHLLCVLREHHLGIIAEYNRTLEWLLVDSKPAAKPPSVVYGAAGDLTAFRLTADPKHQHPTATVPRDKNGRLLPGFTVAGALNTARSKQTTLLAKPKQRRSAVDVEMESV